MSNDQQTPPPEEHSDFEVTPEQPVQPALEPEVPEKYKGKSLTDIIEMHRNAESELGRARNEIGTTRRLADELLGINRAAHANAPAKPVERKKLTPEDLLNNPEDSVLAVVRAEAEERERSLREGQARLESEFALTRFERKHPNYQATMADPKFTEWLQKSPLRLSLGQAATQGNYQAADELFTLFSESQPSAPEREQHDPVEQARKATLTRSSAATGTTGTKPGDAGKKIFSRAALMKMRIEDPEEFDRIQPEVIKAYAEKRVR